MAVAQAARAAALEGDHERAAAMVTRVIEALYDGFLTNDTSKTKLDSKYRVVYVPKDAPEDRKKRHEKVTQQSYCLDLPQAYNHGLLVARAAMAAWRAVKEIDWRQTPWTFQEMTRSNIMNSFTTLITRNAKWMREGMKEQPPAGSNKLDNYPGEFGASWVVWEYRDYTGCDLPGDLDYKYRAEDISHATHDIAFIVDYRQWASEKYSEGAAGLDIFAADDMHKIMVTFLNRVVYDYDEQGSKKFACDVLGIYDDSDWGEPWKQCKGSRTLAERAHFAAAWLPLAFSVRDKVNSDDRRYKALRCDAFKMIDTVLPMILKESDEYYHRFDVNDLRWGFPAIETKYFFYNYKARLTEECAFRKLRKVLG